MNEDDFVPNGNVKNIQINKKNEAETYINTRYISASEAIWRIFGFHLHNEFPRVLRLSIHLPNEQMLVFEKNENLKNVLEKNTFTHLTAYFERNKIDVSARSILFADFPKYYTYHLTNKTWNTRIRGNSEIIGRFLSFFLIKANYFIYECFCAVFLGPYLSTFKLAAKERGLLQDHNEWEQCLQEASLVQSGEQLRLLYSTILLFNEPTDPGSLWNTFKSGRKLCIIRYSKIVG